MKLRQTEYCHACDQHVVFEFDDVIGKQLILCPSCGHRHYREIDEGVITSVRLERYRPWQMVDVPEDREFVSMGGGVFAEFKMPIPKAVLAVIDGHAVVAGGTGKKAGMMVVTDRRWGQDQSQQK